MENIMKNTQIEISSGEPCQNDLELIEQYTKSKPNKDNIYIFRVKLCDNEIDRDFEAFTLDALKSLEALMKGRTGILDHNPTAENQVARLYDCRLITENRKTQTGEDYTYLAGFAYMPKTDATRDFIAAIEAGIKKETSIGCAVKSRICSVCGKDARICGHRKGETYENKLCFTLLDGVTDAYEWSFVAVPAQREAGVMKGFKNADAVVKAFAEKSLNEEKSIEISLEDAKTLLGEIDRLKKENDTHKAELKNEVVRLSLMANSRLSYECMTAIAEKMEYDELALMKSTLENTCVKSASPQIISQRNAAENDDCGFKI